MPPPPPGSGPGASQQDNNLHSVKSDLFNNEALMAAAAAAAAAQQAAAQQQAPSTLERDYYGCYCLKFIVKNGTHTTEDKVLEDFGKYGEVVDIRGPGLFSGLRGNHVYVR